MRSYRGRVCVSTQRKHAIRDFVSSLQKVTAERAGVNAAAWARWHSTQSKRGTSTTISTASQARRPARSRRPGQPQPAAAARPARDPTCLRRLDEHPIGIHSELRLHSGLALNLPGWTTSGRGGQPVHRRPDPALGPCASWRAASRSAPPRPQRAPARELRLSASADRRPAPRTSRPHPDRASRRRWRAVGCFRRAAARRRAV